MEIVRSPLTVRERASRVLVAYPLPLRLVTSRTVTLVTGSNIAATKVNSNCLTFPELRTVPITIGDDIRIRIIDSGGTISLNVI